MNQQMPSGQRTVAGFTKGKSMTSFDETFDFVVVGSGGGSMCAGLLMKTAGKSIVILEKTNLVGGTTSRSGGVMWIPNNPFLKRDGIDDSFDKASTYLETLVSKQAEVAGSTLERRRKYLTEAPRMVEFLMNQGIKLTRVSEWPDYYDDLPGGIAAGRTVIAELFNVNELGAWKQKLQPTFIQVPVPPVLARMKISLPASVEELLELPGINRSWYVKLLAVKLALRGIAAKLTGKQWVGGGGALQGRMLQAAVRTGVEIRTESPVSELIVEGGAVKGVLTTKDGGPWRVAARLGVLVNAGGFARNQRMRDQYIPGTSVKWTMSIAGDTGEMIEEMMRHGAAIAQMEERVGNQVTLPPGAEESEGKPGVQPMTASPHCILIDQSGVRYMNEGGSTCCTARPCWRETKWCLRCQAGPYSTASSWTSICCPVRSHGVRRRRAGLTRATSSRPIPLKRWRSSSTLIQPHSNQLSNDSMAS